MAFFKVDMHRVIIVLFARSLIEGRLHARVWSRRLEKCRLVALMTLLFGNMSVDEVDVPNVFLCTRALLCT